MKANARDFNVYDQMKLESEKDCTLCDSNHLTFWKSRTREIAKRLHFSRTKRGGKNKSAEHREFWGVLEMFTVLYVL